jgi:hypothetical protein
MKNPIVIKLRARVRMSPPGVGYAAIVSNVDASDEQRYIQRLRGAVMSLAQHM